MKYRGKSGVKRWPADKWFSLAIRLANDNVCENCEGEAEECAHLYGRRNFIVRWDVRNAIPLCHRCHNAFTQEPLYWADFIDAKWPGRRKEVQDLMRFMGSSSDATKAAVSKHYNKEYRRMEKTGARDLQNWIP